MIASAGTVRRDAELLDELATVRLRETAPGVFRLDHDSSHHDDRAVALGLAALALTERAPVGAGSVSVPRGRFDRAHALPTSAYRGQAAPLPGSHEAGRLARRAAGAMPAGLPGGAVLGVPGAWDDPRRADG